MEDGETNKVSGAGLLVDIANVHVFQEKATLCDRLTVSLRNLVNFC